MENLLLNNVQPKLVTFNKYSHKLEKPIQLLNLPNLPRVPVKSYQAYTLVGKKNRGEKRAEIYRCKQETGVIYRNMIQNFNKGKKPSADEIKKFAIGIDFLVQNKQNVSSGMINTLAKGIKNIANQIENLEAQNQDISPDMVNALAKGIDTLLSPNIKKDLSYELKVLSKAILTFVKNCNDDDKNTLNQLMNTFDSLKEKVLKNKPDNKLTINLEDGANNYSLALKTQQATYGKDAKGVYKYDRNSSEIYNFNQGYRTLDEFCNTFIDSSDSQQQQENKIERRKQINKAIDIILIKLKNPKTFKDDVSFNTIMKEYAAKEQEEVGVKNSDIRIVGNDIVFFTHQYDTTDTNKIEELNLDNGEKVNAKKDSVVKIADNDSNRAKLNDLIALLKSHCHENSYACLTHLVHRAIERFGKSDNSYNLDETIKSIRELLSLKDTILNSSRKQVDIKDINTIKRDINNLSNKQYDNKTTQNIINSLSSFLKNIDDEDTKKAIQEHIEKLKIIQCTNSKPNAKAYANKIYNKYKTGNKQDIVNFLNAKPDSPEEEDALGDKFENMKTKYKELKEPYIQSVKKHEKFKEECNKYMNKYPNFNGEVANIETLKNTLKIKLNEYIKKQFTLFYSDQGNKYNYNAYELTTELGTLILDNEGKVTTIMDRTILNS